MNDYGKDPFLALGLYAVLMNDFGLEIFGTVHKRYNNIKL